jgi:hypothetical protein
MYIPVCKVGDLHLKNKLDPSNSLLFLSYCTFLHHIHQRYATTSLAHQPDFLIILTTQEKTRWKICNNF